jgi:dipeptidyl aminopeptidase/acylaminoacyl peptidase
MKVSRRACLASLAGVALLPAPPPASAQTGGLPYLIPRAVLFGNPERASPTLSPDGTRLAYLAPKDGVMNVWVRTLGQKDDKPVTAETKRPVYEYYWQPDGKGILYLQDEGGNENFHLYQVNAAGGSPAKDLTPFPNVRASVYAVDPAFPDTILLGLNRRNPALFDVHKLDLKTGALTLVEENRDGYAGYASDHRMAVRAATKILPDGSTRLMVRDSDGANWRELTTVGPDDSVSVVGFSPDNAKIWLGSSAEAEAARLLEVDLATSAVTVVAEDATYDVGNVLTHPTRRTLEAVSFERERTEWKIMDKSVAGDFSALRKVRDGDFSVVSRDSADKTWVVRYLLDDGPVYWYLYDRATKKATVLFPSQIALQGYQLAKMKPVSFRASDGLRLHGYLTLPVGVEPVNLPTVLLVHGGPWGRDSWGLDPVAQWLANRGYAVLQVNFRGSTGYGKKYLNAGNREWAAKMHTDLVDGKKWLVKQGVADPAKVAIMGGSYGGYATLVGLTFTPEEFACGVDIVGPSNLNTLLATIPPYWEPIKAMFARRVGADEAFLATRSPIHKADRITKPLLIAQGANDPRVKQAESDQIVAALRKAGKPVEYVVFPDEGHGFARPENNLYFTARAELFLRKHLGGRYEPARGLGNHSGMDK